MYASVSASLSAHHVLPLLLALLLLFGGCELNSSLEDDVPLLPGPHLRSPVDAATGLAPNVRLAWTRVADVDSYRVQLDEAPDFEAPALDTVVADTALSVTGLARAAYSWRVGAVRPDDVTWSEARRFAITPLDAVPRLYVANQDAATVAVIDMQANEVMETVDLRDYGFTATAKPHHVAVDADGSWYVTLIGEDAVAKFSRANELLGTAAFEAPGMLAVHPTEDLLYSGHTLSIPDVPSTLATIRRSDMDVLGVVDVSLSRPHGVAVHPGGAYAYTTSLTLNQMAVVDTETQDVDLKIVGSGQPRFLHFAIDSSGTTMVLTGHIPNQAYVLDVSDPADPQLVESIGVGAEPWHPIFLPGGRYAYFGNKGANTVTRLDTETNETLVIEHASFAQPHGSAVSPDGRYVYISNQSVNQPSGTVSVIDVETNEVIEVIPVGQTPAGLGS